MVVAVSLSTLVGASALIDVPQEDRREIREAQDLDLWSRIDAASSIPLAPEHRDRFFVAPLDLLPERVDGVLSHHLLELNGTGIGGLTNLPESTIEAIMRSFGELPAAIARLGDAAPVVIIGISGRDASSAEPSNRLAHEKLLYAEALAQGFARLGSRAEVISLDRLDADLVGGRWQPQGPTVVIGYNSELVRAVSADCGRMTLHGAPVSAVVNDRLFAEQLAHLGHRIDPNRMLVANATFAAGTDKSVALELADRFLATGPVSGVARQWSQAGRASDVGELERLVLEWLRVRRRPVVVKPHASGGGAGIEFFLDVDEPTDEVVTRLRASLDATAAASGRHRFPYTVCDFIDADRWPDRTHRLSGHRYELRIVAYRDDDRLRAFPSIVKFASERYEPSVASRAMLINNITAGRRSSGRPGTRLMLPLCNLGTLAAMGLSVDGLTDLCRFTTRYVHFVLDRLADPTLADTSRQEVA